MFSGGSSSIVCSGGRFCGVDWEGCCIMRGLLDAACSIGENAGASCSEDVLIRTVPGCIKFGPKQC